VKYTVTGGVYPFFILPEPYSPRKAVFSHLLALLRQSSRSYMLALELMTKSVQLQDRRYQFYLSFDNFNDI
jgi:hypothetical protein